jgi:Ca2+-transporting ATPase
MSSSSLPTSAAHTLNAQTVQAWHTLDIDTAIQTLHSDRDQGLTSTEVAKRLQRYGANELQETGGRTAWQILWDQFKNVMLLMLIAVAVISGILDLREAMASAKMVVPKDTIAILSIVILNGVLGYIQESGAERALAALKSLSSPNVRVLRDGKLTEVTSKELVPGDVMLLDAGVKVAADGRLIEEANLQVREAALTGEALAVHKHANLELPEDTELGDRINLVFTGTEVVQGRATVLVTSIGMQTELGKIASDLQSVESEPTPLQKRYGQLGIALGTLQNPQNFEELVKVALSMAVAVVPEGLPAVITVTLALGTQRMVKRNALIRKLPAVETLGSVTTICSDKTGTLTQNKMVVQTVMTDGHMTRITGEGYTPTGEFLNDRQESISPLEHLELQTLLLSCVLCNDATLQFEAGQWLIMGDPTEGALLTLAAKAGLEKDQQASYFPRVAEFPFSSERKRMSVIVAGQGAVGNGHNPNALPCPFDPSPYGMFTKGSAELTLDRCQTILVEDGVQPLNAAQRSRILEQNNTLAAHGLRVLGFACRGLSVIPDENTEENYEQDLIWLGLVGMLDAPRPEVREAVARCRTAGIRPVMITGDHQLTARAIAEDLNIAQPSDQTITGRELEHVTPTELEGLVEQISVYARVSPEHKLRIVQALQRRGHVVAMTGDGVNDAPALKQADIGVAMGITGTDVSKEASDMVLLDDNFATIVSAAEEGRVVYSNIRRFIRYILGSNIGEVITIASAPLLGLQGVPLSPLQILWMNLVTDGIPALALAVEPGRPSIMQQPPKNPKESIFARGLGTYIVRIGIVLAIITIILMVWAYSYTTAPNAVTSDLLRPERWKTMVFTTLCLSQMGHAIAIRSNSRLAIELDQLANPYILASVIVTSLLQLALIYITPLRNFFGTYYLTPIETLVCIGFSILVFVWVDLEKLFIRWYRSQQRAEGRGRKPEGNSHQ